MYCWYQITEYNSFRDTCKQVVKNSFRRSIHCSLYLLLIARDWDLRSENLPSLETWCWAEGTWWTGVEHLWMLFLTLSPVKLQNFSGRQDTDSSGLDEPG